MLKIKTSLFTVFTVTLVVCLALSSCVTTTSAEHSGLSANAPDWVVDPIQVYPESQFFSAIGYGSNREGAEAAAISQLGKTIRQNVQSHTTAKEGFSEGAQQALQTSKDYSTSVETTTNIAALVGVSIKQTWFDKKNATWYALAQMNKQETATYYSNQIKENNKSIENLITFSAANPQTFSGYNALIKASSIARETENAYDILSVVNSRAALLLSADRISSKELTTMALTEAEKTTIGIYVENDLSGRLTAAFTKVFTEKGYKTRTLSAKTDTALAYALFARVEITELGSLDNKNFFIRYNLDSLLTDIRNNKGVLPFTTSGREGHVTVSEAKQRSFRLMEKEIVSDFTEKFAELMKE